MTKAHRRLVIFWMIAGPLLVTWWFFLYWMNRPQRIVAPMAYVTNILPLHSKIGDAARIVRELFSAKQERTYLILVHDARTARPTGGLITSVVAVTVHDGVVTSVVAHDPATFAPIAIDQKQYSAATVGLPSGINPFSMQESNWFADFPTSARIAAHIYRAQFSHAVIDAVLSVDAVALDAFMEIMGPIVFDGCSVYDGDSVVRRQCVHARGVVEPADTAFTGDALAALATSVSDTASVWQRMALLRAAVHMCDAKHVQIVPLSAMNLAAPLQRRGWDGAVDTAWNKDYVMVDDGAVSPRGVETRVARSVTYAVDLSQSIPQAAVTVRYAYGTRDTRMSVMDYEVFVRVTVPRNTWFTSAMPCIDTPHYGMKYGKRYAACTVRVPYGATTEVTFHYNLPIDVRNHYPYDLKMQHCAGFGVVPWTIRITKTGDDAPHVYTTVIDRDMTLRRDVMMTPFL